MRLHWSLAGLGTVAVIVVAILVERSPYREMEGPLHITGPLIAAVFLATGTWAWSRRPQDRIGQLMVAGAFAWLAATLFLAQESWLFMTGLVLFVLPYALLVHLFLAFPSGRLQTRLDRGLVAGGYFTTVGLQIPQALAYEPKHICLCGMPERSNPLLIGRNEGLIDIISVAQSVIAIVALAIGGWVLAQRYLRAEPRQRHALRPVLGAGVVIVVSLVFTTTADLTSFFDDIERKVDALSYLLIACVPALFLAGLARSRFSRAVAVSALAEQLQRGTLQDALGAALGDPTLRLAYAVGDHFADEDGVPVALPVGGHTLVERDGHPVGAIVHATELAAEEPEGLRSAAAAAGLAMENVRLQAERLEDVRASRARLVDAADAERRRLERDLHDGAQQRLVSLALTLRVARGRSKDADVTELLEEAAAQLAAATDELRELARGIHPAVLTDRGLGPAIGALARRATLPVEVRSVPQERLPAALESAAYFLVAEALTNVSRYAQATVAEVSVARENGHVTVAVSDDGIGGADPGAGSGLSGMADRVAALNGSLEVTSPDGAGTTIKAVLPCGW